jgi:hypothetical protein
VKLRLDIANATASVTHLMWVGRWIEVTRSYTPGFGPSWTFKNGRDAADWLRWGRQA